MPAFASAYRVLENRSLGPDTFILRFERHALPFKAGQHLSVGLPGQEQREYSVYSGEQDPWFEILVREVQGGRVSRALRRTQPGDRLEVTGPFGFFTLEQPRPSAPYLFVATGTGIAPFHSLVRSVPGLDYTLVHGIRRQQERYGHEEYATDRLAVCVSQEPGPGFQGRVTAWLKTQTQKPETRAYLCGNCDMIYEVFDLLKEQGLPASQIYTEVYF